MSESHDFRRDRSCKSCSLCLNLWPSGESVVSKFNVCSKCGLDVHSSCTEIARQCYPCDKASVRRIIAEHCDFPPDFEGRITSRVLHAYDIEVAAGTTLYYVLKLSSADATIRGPSSTVGDRDCVWPNEKGTSEESFASYNSKYSGDVDGIFLEVHLWKSVMKVFDSPIANCQIKMKPLFLHPYVLTERWFELKDTDGGVFGKVLVDLKFMPFRPVTTKIKTVVSPSHSLLFPAVEGMGLTSLTSYTAGIATSPRESDTSVLSSVDNDRNSISHNSTNTFVNIPSSTTPNSNQLSFSQIQSVDLVPKESAQKLASEAKEKAEYEREQKLSKLAKEAEMKATEQRVLQVKANEQVRIDNIQKEMEEEKKLRELKINQEQDQTDDRRIEFRKATEISVIKVQQERKMDSMVADSKQPADLILTPKPTKSLTKSLFKLSTNDKSSLVDEKITPSRPAQGLDNNDTSFFTPSNSEKEQVVTPKTGSKDSHDSHDSPGALYRPMSRDDLSKKHDEIKTLTERDEIKEEMLKIEKTAVSMVAKWSDMRRWTQWAQTTSLKAQGVLTTVLANKSEKKKGKDFHGVGVGKLYVSIISAQKTNVTDAAVGKYYVLITVKDSEQEERTNSVSSSSSPVFNKEFQFVAPHFRSGVRLDLMDADTETRVGTSYLSVYSLLMRDADFNHSDWRKAKEEKYFLRESEASEKEPLGYVLAKIQFEEDVCGLFTDSTPHLAPCGPEEELSVERLRVHIGRFQALIEWITQIYNDYCSIMNWDEPLLTFVLLLIFLYMVFKVDSEYGLSGPIFILVALMTRDMYLRCTGLYRDKWICKLDKEAKKPIPQIHRPLAYLRLSVIGFRGFSSSIVGVGGMPLHALENRAKKGVTRPPWVKVTYVPSFDDAPQVSTSTKEKPATEYDSLLDEKVQESIKVYAGDTPERNAKLQDPADKGKEGKQKKIKEHLIACISTASPSLTVNADAVGAGGNRISQLMSSLNFLRNDSNSQDEIIQNVCAQWPPLSLDFDVIGEDASCGKGNMIGDILGDSDDICLMYPVLQSLSVLEPSKDTPSASNTSKIKLEAWSKNESVIKFSFYNDNPTSRFIDSSWGMFVDVPLKDLVDSELTGGVQREKRGWFSVRRVHTADVSSTETPGLPSTSGIDDFDFDMCHSNNGNANFRGQSTPLTEEIGKTASFYRTDKTVSTDTGAQILVRMQMELSKIAPKNSQPKAADIEKSILLEKILSEREGKSGNALSVLFNMRDNIKYVQNLMSYILNAIESYKNLLNWTAPSKTFPIYCCLVGIWVLTICVPGRYLILALGLYQFLFRFLPEFDPLPNEIRLYNVMEALPNDDDIQHAYSREQKAYVTSKEDEVKFKFRAAKLNLMFNCIWQGNVQIKAIGIGNGVVWCSAFSVLQESRFVWWLKEEDVDDGKAPQGQLLLFGHAGITQPSPVDVREIGDDARIATIFGRDSQGLPHKWTVVCKDMDSCRQLVEAVNAIVDRSNLTALGIS